MAKNTTEVKKVSRIKEKKKGWYRILAPKVFGQKELGETYLESPSVAVGRVLNINLKDLSGNVRDQNAYVNFKVIQVEGTQLHTSAIGYQLTPASIKRMVRKNADRMDDYFTFNTKDGRKVIVKSLMVTIHLTQRSVQSKLRTLLADSLRQEIHKLDFDTLLFDVATYKIQEILKRKLCKVYPLKEMAIRMLLLNKDAGEKNDSKTESEVSEEKIVEEAEVTEESTSPEAEKEKLAPKVLDED